MTISFNDLTKQDIDDIKDKCKRISDLADEIIQDIDLNAIIEMTTHIDGLEHHNLFLKNLLKD